MSEIWVNRARGAHTGRGGQNNIMRIRRGRKGEPIEKYLLCIRHGSCIFLLVSFTLQNSLMREIVLSSCCR